MESATRDVVESTTSGSRGISNKQEEDAMKSTTIQEPWNRQHQPNNKSHGIDYKRVRAVESAARTRTRSSRGVDKKSNQAMKKEAVESVMRVRTGAVESVTNSKKSS